MENCNTERRDAMKKMAIVGGAFMAISAVGISVGSKQTISHPNEQLHNELGNQYGLSGPENDVFVVLKRNLSYSKKVKDEQLVEFSKELVKHSPEGTNFKEILGSFQSQFLLGTIFARYAHA
ncbi:hypothetical protein KSS82_12750 [Vibrio mimicus]|nr:hypothetical protein [Vibrio mimicus]QXC58891.1 hypothetical protein KSS82_12750 [Vibrio mimicus]